MTMEVLCTTPITRSHSGTTPKQKLLSFQQKKQICVFHNDHPEMKQIHLIKYFTKQFDLPYLIPKSSISELLRNKNMYLSNTCSDKKKSKAQYPHLEESLYAWYLNERSTSGATVADTQLIEKAESLCKTLSLDGFKCSSGWLYRFKHRYELNEKGNHVADDQSQDDDDQSHDTNSDCMSQTDVNNENDTNSLSGSLAAALASVSANKTTPNTDDLTTCETKINKAQSMMIQRSGGQANMCLSSANLEYDRIKYNFLNLLKQFKIFEFDKFMQWLEKLVNDYQRIGYNVIENLESELIAFSNNKSLQHKPMSDMSGQRPNRHKNNDSKQTQQHLDGTNKNAEATASSASTNNAISTTSPNCVKSEACDLNLDDMYANSKIKSNKLNFENINSQQQQHGNHVTAADAVVSSTQISPTSLYHAKLLNHTSNRKSKINEQQLIALETVFKQKQYLNQFEKEQLSILLNITPLQVKGWFKNRRYRQKKTEQQIHNQENLISQDDSKHEDECDDELSQNEFMDDVDASESAHADEADDLDDFDQENTLNSDSNDQESAIGTMMHKYNYHQPKHSPAKSSVNASPTTSPTKIFQAKQIDSSSLLAAAALAAVTTNVPVQSSQTSLIHQLNTIKFSKTLNDELERVFDKQKYISNTQRDYFAEKFQVESTQITNWFQNKRRKLKRLERELKNSKFDLGV